MTVSGAAVTVSTHKRKENWKDVSCSASTVLNFVVQREASFPWLAGEATEVALGSGLSKIRPSSRHATFFSLFLDIALCPAC